MSYGWFQTGFASWVSELDIRCVPHQALHTLATSLIRNGANLSHVKRYLGHVSDAMAEHYVKCWVLHRMGENPQVARSARYRNSVSDLRTEAA
jgi:integrase